VHTTYGYNFTVRFLVFSESCIDYMKEHPTTTAKEFKPIWDRLSSDVKKTYEELSKTKKRR
ncbi:hypothetical protein CPC08DRAFT_713824, partial [Agrocybe pediades]